MRRRRVRGTLLIKSMPMRIALLAPEHAEFSRTATVLTLGSGGSDEVQLKAVGVQPGHVRLFHDLRGYVLEVADAAPAIHVNARQVRRRALLHVGDQISIGDAQLLVLGEHVPEPCPERVTPDATLAPGAMTLRGVGGVRSGAVLMVAPTLELGADGLPLGPSVDDAHVRLFAVQGRPALLASGLAATAWRRVNGHTVASAWLQDGDQIAIGAQRYIVDAPAAAARVAAAAAFIPHEAARPEDTAGPRREVWWLLLTAAVIALVLALLLAVRR